MGLYSLQGHGSMLADRVRTAAYAEALRRAVRPGMVVADIGTGMGIFALLACRLGARRVYAVEQDDVIQVAREAAAANGYADRIECIQAVSTRVELPERADVVISDLRGVLPLFGQHIGSIADARRRLLAADGTLICRRDTLWAAVVSAPEWQRERAAAWDECGFGFDLRAARRLTVNTWGKRHVRPEQLLVAPRAWATLDYTSVTDPNVSGKVGWEAEHSGAAHGLAVWFDAELFGGAGFSNAPGGPELIYGQAFFPLPEPVEITPGDRVEAALRADLVGDDYVWGWETAVANGRETKARFKQSTFLGAPLSPARLRRAATSHRPALSEEGRVEQFILAQMDGETPLEEVAARLARRFARRFPTRRDALARVCDLSERFSE
jgi:type I protein arginine methyltransferase